jgi:glycoside/pentoside/hexuronide:cation symporter, GPH family
MERRVALSYSTGAVGTGIFATVPGLLLLYYLTDVIGVAAGIASLVLFVPKIWDAVLNPVVGAFSDRSGARRPYLLAGAIGTPLMFALLFSAPDLGTPARTALYVGIIYTLAMTGYALFQVPWVAMPTEMTPDYHARTRLMSTRMVLLTVGILAGGALAPLLSGGKSGGRGGYALMSVVLALVLAAAMLTAWRGTRGAVAAAPATRRLSAREQLAIVRGNRPFLVLFGGYVAQAVATGAMLAGTPYVATYVLGDAALASVLFVFLVAPAALVMPLWRRLSERKGKLFCYLLASGLFGLTAVSLLAARSEPHLVVFAQMMLLGIGYAGIQLFPYAMLPDAIGEGSRAGVFTGVWQAGETIGFAVGPALYALTLATVGFVSSAADQRVQQPPGALTGVVLGFSVLPALLILLSIPLLRRYPDPEVR